MATELKFTMTQDNTEQMLKACREQRARALEMIGLYAEGKAKDKCPIDTGRLRNSITHICDSRATVNTASVGTNVEYGKYVELGTVKMGARPFIKPSIADHLDTYQSMIEQCLRS